MTYQTQLQSLRSQDPPPREVELKFAIPEASAGALKAHLQARAANAETRHEVTTYFDTPDRVLQRGGISLRVRAAGADRVQTLKADSQDGVAADRAEWEWKIEQDEPDLRPAERVLKERGVVSQIDLEPVFRTEVDRTKRILHLDGGAAVETAYDEGRITAGDAHQPIRELELELHSGDAAPLYRLACELHAAAPLMIATESKGARGYRLASGKT
jgi:inorganic triphosphatase YgiF